MLIKGIAEAGSATIHEELVEPTIFEKPMNFLASETEGLNDEAFTCDLTLVVLFKQVAL